MYRRKFVRANKSHCMSQIHLMSQEGLCSPCMAYPSARHLSNCKSFCMRPSKCSAGFRTIGNDVDDVTDLVLVEVGRERDLYAFVSIAHFAAVQQAHHSLLLEIPRERIARTCAKTGGVTHGECSVSGGFVEVIVIWSRCCGFSRSFPSCARQA